MENGPVPQSGQETPGGETKVLRRFRTQFDQNYNGTPGEVFTLPSQTVPDQSLTVAQLLLNHTRGIESDVADYEGEYFEDIPIPRVDDITDLAVYREELKAQAEQLDQEVKNEVERKKSLKDEVTRNLESGSNPFASGDRDHQSTGEGRTPEAE